MAPKQAGTLIVAAAFVALSLAEGGYSVELRAALTILVWAAVLGGLASGVLPRAPIRRPALAAGLLLAAFAGWAFLSMGWASDNGLAFAEAVRAAGYLGLFVLVLCASSPGSGRYWLLGLALGAVVVAALAVGSRLVPALPGDDSELNSLLPAAQGRLSYPIGYWNALGAIMAMGLVLVTWLAANAGKPLQRILAGAAIPLLALCLYLTSSRGGAAAAAVGLAALVLLDAKRARSLAVLLVAGAGSAVLVFLASRRGDLLDGLETSTAETQGLELLAATLLVVAAVALVVGLLDRGLERLRFSPATWRVALGVVAVAGLAALVAADPAQRWENFKAPPEETPGESGFVASHFSSGSGSGRYQYWEAAADAFAEQPLRGLGAGGYTAYWLENASIAQLTRDATSLYLETLAELGAVGLILLLGFLGTGLVAAAIRWRGPPGIRPELVGALALFVTVAVSAGVDWIWEVPAAFAPLVVAVALLTGPALAPRDGEEAGLRAGFGWGIATLGVAWVAMIAAAIVFLTERSIDESRSAAADGDYSRAAEKAADGVALQPWAASPRLQLALSQEADGRLVAARESLDEAIERAADDWVLWLALARIETRAGEIEAARAALERARELNPQAPIFAEEG